MLTGMNSQFSGLGIGPGGPPMPPPPSSSSAFSLPILGSLVSGPGSPGRSMLSGATGPPPLDVVTSTSNSSPSPFSGLMPPGQVPPGGVPPVSVASKIPTTGLGPTGPNSGATISAAATMATNSGMQSGIEQIRQGNISQIFPELPNHIPKEIEDKANSYFQRIYNVPPHPTLTINEVLELLKKFQDSADARERDVFLCMIKNLFEEYKYFPQYPQKELYITAQLFGGIIEQGLVTMVPLGLALRFVLDAVRKPSDTNMYYFGVTALDRFKMRLKDYPQYCQHITCIDHFKNFPPHLIEWVEAGVQSQMPANKPQGDVLPSHIEATLRQVQQQQQLTSGAPGLTATGGPGVSAVIGSGTQSAIGMPSKTPITTTVTTTTSSTAASTIVRPTATTIGGRPSIANTTNIDTLLNARQKQGMEMQGPQSPSDKVQDKVAFIFNNLSLMNMQQKADDLKENLSDEFTGWLAQYMVMKRASIEPNFHTLYSNFLEVLRNPGLYREVLSETYSNIRILLGSDKGIANYSDRSLLKNLGHWLGLMTLSRNKPILMVDLDLKPLVIEAFHNGQQELLYVVPFVAKVLESCAKSKVFKPPCPWTMGIMNLLAELHQEHDLKLNLKFEIEVLCKTLTLELTALTPGTLLKEYDKLNRTLNIINFGMNTKTTNQSQASAASASGFLGTSAGPRKLDPTGMSGPDLLGPSNLPSMMSTGMAPPSVTAPSQHSMTGLAGAGMGGALASQPPQPPPQHFTPQLPPVTSSVEHVGIQPSGGSDTHLAQMLQQQQQQGTATGVTKQYEPKFSFTEINTQNLNGIVPHIVIDQRLNLLKDHSEMTHLAKLAIEKSIQDWLNPCHRASHQDSFDNL